MGRTVVIMQPTYLPWVGYFDLIDQADVFVLLDDAQFSKQSWHHRNRIRTPKGLEWITVPVRHTGHFPLSIANAETVTETGFVRKHLRTIELNYRRSPHFDAYFPQLREVLATSDGSLAALNTRLIVWLAERMRIATRFELNTVMGARGQRVELMLDICRRLEAQTCLMAIGSVDYLSREYNSVQMPELKLLFHQYVHPVWHQAFHPFLPYASAIDLLFNEGERAIEIVRAGRRESYTLKEFTNNSIALHRCKND